MLRSLLALTALVVLRPSSAPAAGAPASCLVRSAELKLARECYTGDMRNADDQAAFLGLNETSPVDLNYCFNAFVYPYPVQGARVSLLVLRDDPHGQVVARNYSLSAAALAATMGRVPTKRTAQVLILEDLEAPCYAKNPATNTCSKGFLGFGSTDLPFAFTLEGDLRGYTIGTGVRDRTLTELPGVARIRSSGVAPAGQTLEFLVGQVKQRIVGRARRDLQILSSQPTEATRDELARGGSQFRYCRLAFDSLNQRLRRPDPYAAEEHSILDNLEARMQNPAAPSSPTLAPTTAATAAAAAAAPSLAPTSPAAPRVPTGESMQKPTSAFPPAVPVSERAPASVPTPASAPAPAAPAPSELAP